MSETKSVSTPVLAGVTFVAAIVGALVVLGVQHFVPSAGNDRAEIQSVVRDYVVDNPQIIPDAMDKLRERETAKFVEANADAIKQPFAAAWQGAKDPAVNVVVYMDYACTFCRASLKQINRLAAEQKDVRIVYRELPILSEQSRSAALWSLAAAKQGKFKPFHDALFASASIGDDAIAAAARQAGLDMKAAQQFARSDAAMDEIRTNLAVANQLGMGGTPAWVIGDQVIAGAQPYDALVKEVDAARAKG